MVTLVGRKVIEDPAVVPSCTWFKSMNSITFVPEHASSEVYRDHTLAFDPGQLHLAMMKRPGLGHTLPVGIVNLSNRQAHTHKWFYFVFSSDFKMASPIISLSRMLLPFLTLCGRMQRYNSSTGSLSLATWHPSKNRFLSPRFVNGTTNPSLTRWILLEYTSGYVKITSRRCCGRCHPSLPPSSLM